VKAALYLRVSTDEQSVDSQRAELLAECQRRGWEPVEFVDEGVSGAKTERPALERMLKEVRARHVKAVLCYKLDRLGRSLQHLVQLVEFFRSKDCALIVPGQGIDTSVDNPVAKLQMHMLAAVCEFERSLIRERIKAGMSKEVTKERLAKRKPRGLAKGMESKMRRASVILHQDPDMTVAELAREIDVSVGTAWRIRCEMALKKAVNGPRANFSNGIGAE
jgi:DNA invertase Pin-like site-specific DNA recombinase